MDAISLPEARGPVSRRLLTDLSRPPGRLGWMPDGELDEEDLQLALYCCYELHYGGLPGVDAEWEWEPSLLEIRGRLEARFLERIAALVAPRRRARGPVKEQLWALAGETGGRSLSAWVSEHATVGHLRELAVHRAPYQLKEADPHTWCIPRITGRSKAAMVAIQADEYGDGSAARMHASLFGLTMGALGLDPTPNRYLDLVPAVTLATTNLISLFGLHRRWRGALVGHLALFEMTSIQPMSRYARAFRRLGFPEQAHRFYDVHVEADRIHQDLAADAMVGGLLDDEPALAADVLFGATALGALEARFAAHVLDHWESGRGSLRTAASAATANPFTSARGSTSSAPTSLCPLP